MFEQKPILPDRGAATYETFRRDWGTLGGIAFDYLEDDHDFQTMHREFNLVLGIKEDYLLEDLMTFAYCADHFRRGWHDDHYNWNLGRVKGCARYGLNEISEIFRDFIGYVEGVAGDTEKYPDLNWRTLKSAPEIQQELTSLQARLKSVAQEISHGDLADHAITTYSIEIRPFVETVTLWRDLILDTEKYAEKVSKAKALELSGDSVWPLGSRALRKAGVTWNVRLFEFMLDAPNGKPHLIFESDKGTLYARSPVRQDSTVTFFRWPEGDVFCSLTDKNVATEGEGYRIDSDTKARTGILAWFRSFFWPRGRKE